MTATTAQHHARAPRPAPAPPRIPRDPAAPDHRWPDRWPLRTQLELAPLLTAPGCARAHASAVLREWGLTAITDETTLIVSELVTNAVLSTRAHGLPDPVRLWLLGSGSGGLILTWDATRRAPVQCAPAPETEHGRGLEIVHTLSARWGYYHPAAHPGGKVTWALITSEVPAPACATPARRTAA